MQKTRYTFFWRTSRRRRTRRVVSKKSRAEYLQYKEAARELVYARLAYFNQVYGYEIKKIFIKNVKTRWGSASKLGNLNFSYKLALLPPELADYVVVHELCHLGQFNHSPKFWALVAQTTPHYKTLRAQLHKVRL